MEQIIIATGIGAFGGWAYWRWIGCSSGTCAITKNKYMSILYGALLGLMVVTSGGCKSSNDTDVPKTGTSIQTASIFENISPAAFADKLQEPGVMLIDVRTPEEFAEGHLAGAINMNINDSGFESSLARLDKSKTYLIYCRSGARSGRAGNLMVSKGFTTIYNLDGGILAWKGEVVK